MYRTKHISCILFIFSIIGLLASCNDEGKLPPFELSSQETLALINTDGYWYSSQEALSWQKNQDEAYRFVDIRSSIEFDKGSLEGAINLPLQHLLEQESLEFFSDGKKIVLFGETEEDAHGAWLLLRQMGYGNVLLLQGGYSFQIEPDGTPYLPPQRARYNYASMMAAAVMQDKKEEEATRPKAAPQPIVRAPKQIVPQKKAAPKVVEEEEGC